MMIKIRLQGITFEEVKVASETIENNPAYSITYKSGIVKSGSKFNRYYIVIVKKE